MNHAGILGAERVLFLDIDHRRLEQPTDQWAVSNQDGSNMGNGQPSTC
jgi:hypothetical protein